nr:l-rhamnono-gamma-lactonase [Quercus suber]
MLPHVIIDSHVHLWPGSAANEARHAWMSGDPAQWKEQLLSDYQLGTDHDTSVSGIVYVETDRRYTAPKSGEEMEVEKWAAGPLEEIAFLREMVEHAPERGMLLGLVPWAPMDQPTAVLERYLDVAEKRAGSQAWKCVKGFRFLLQAIVDQDKFEALVLGETFKANLRLLGERGFLFEVGVDQRSGGTRQLEAVAKAMQQAQSGVALESHRITFVINHLCKPDFSRSKDERAFADWHDAISTMAECPRTFMKLSGAFSELPLDMKSTTQIAEHMIPWVRHVLDTFGADRIMFGSDWPVCTFRGPAQEKSWVSWRDVVKSMLQNPSLALDDVSQDRIWSATAVEAYHLSQR